MPDENKPVEITPATPANNDQILALGQVAAELMSHFITQAINEPEKIKAAADVEKSKLLIGLGTKSLYVAGGIIVAFLIAAVIVFFQGEKGLVSQVITGGFGFLAGIGFSRFLPQKSP